MTKLANIENTIVIIPVYNAENHLRKLIKEIYAITKNIMVIDDGSSDKSEEIYSSFPVKFYKFAQNKGKGAALKFAFDTAIKSGYEFAITLDSDYQHLPNDIPKFLKRQVATKANLIYGKRVFSPFKMPIQRILSNFLTSLIVSVKIKKMVYDSQCGFRLYDLEFIKGIKIDTQRYQTETEIILKFAKMNAKFDFVPIKTIYQNQKSYISHLRDIKNFLQVILSN